MDDAERDHFSSLPEVLTIYRGVNRQRAFRGLSWTLERDRAVWFADHCLYRNPRKQSFVLKAKLPKVSSVAYFACRSEQKIVVNPAALRTLNTTIID